MGSVWKRLCRERCRGQARLGGTWGRLDGSSAAAWRGVLVELRVVSTAGREGLVCKSGVASVCLMAWQGVARRG